MVAEAAVGRAKLGDRLPHNREASRRTQVPQSMGSIQKRNKQLFLRKINKIFDILSVSKITSQFLSSFYLFANIYPKSMHLLIKINNFI
jgi:hypothetical protein